MLEINAEEIDRTLALLGVPQIDAVDRSCLRSEDTDA
jgi:isopentenyl diphosphate isomerase/L-lactate dehydrogenase-like FMN-dependent dehydrogenase